MNDRTAGRENGLQVSLKWNAVRQPVARPPMQGWMEIFRDAASSRIPQGQQGPILVSNTILRRDPHGRTFARFLQAALAATLVAASCGCHYCPHNRHALRPGCACASESLYCPWYSHPGGRRWTGGSDTGCTDEVCTNNSCDSARSQAYYSESTPIEAPPSPTESTTESPLSEPSLLEPFTPVENYPEPPSTNTPIPMETTGTQPSTSADTVTPAPLFEGRVELNGIEAEPRTQLPAFPVAPAPTPEAAPAPMGEFPPPPPVQERVLPAEDPEEVSDNSLFPLRFAPRLFRLREEATVETQQPVVPAITEASWMQGSRLGGHLMSAPSAPATMTTSRGNEVRSGHSTP